MKILTNAARGCRRGPADWFTGEVWLDSVLDPALLGGNARINAAQVSGLGWVQLEGEAAQPIRPGDVVVIAPGENHWHGAEGSHTMVHLALQENDAAGIAVTWGKPVTDSEYAG